MELQFLESNYESLNADTSGNRKEAQFVPDFPPSVKIDGYILWLMKFFEKALRSFTFTYFFMAASHLNEIQFDFIRFFDISHRIMRSLNFWIFSAIVVSVLNQF